MNAILESPAVPTPEPLYQLVMGFTGTRTLLAAHRLGVFEALATGGKTAADLARDHRWSLEPTDMLLDACTALGLCEKNAGRYALTPVVRAYLLRQGPAYLGHFFDHFNDHMIPAWFFLEDLIRTGEPQMHRVRGEKEDHFFQALDRSPDDLNTFMQTMEEHSLLEGAALAAAYDFSSHHLLLDVAGGTGAMSVAVLQRYPQLRARVVERPSACPIAEEAVRAHGLAARIEVQPGDMFQRLPEGADVLLLSGTLHNWGPAQAQAILRQCHRAMAVGATLLINEQVLDEEKSKSPLGPLCSLNMMVLMGGREYSSSEYRTMLVNTGFALKDVRPTGGLRQLIVAQRL